MTKRFPGKIAAAALGLALTASLAACGGSGDKADDNAAGTAGAGITFWNGFTSSDRPAVEQIVKNFNAAHPDEKVDMTIVAWDSFYQKLLPAYAAGNGPTVAGMDALQMPGYTSKNVFAPLDDLYADWPESKDFNQAAVDITKFDGKQYGAPMSVTTTALYYNKTLMGKAGLTTPPKTLDELAADAVKLTKVNPSDESKSVYGFAFPDHGAVSTMTAFMQANGGGVVEDGKSVIASPASVQTAQTWADHVRQQHISPIGLSGDQADALFAAGRVGFYINGPWASSSFTKSHVDFGVTSVPAGSVTQAATLNDVAMAVSAKASAAQKKSAYDFIKFWNSPAQQKYWAVTSGNSPTTSAVTPDQLSANPAAAQFAAVTGGKAYIQGQTSFNQIDADVVVPTVQKLFAGQGDAATLFKAADAQITPLLAK